ncbi:PfkB family carbohydrate kinase [Nocardioides zeae]|uniref:PfkB family carbohydrate kinase n=1 Tax=Nocardioides imazamoxiresistens TaxID=3231893 RepID=A0ABU3PUJ6_9ACTN|nr:PfkB family carbohydrate kinase [Nocardioides zeae]MDT9592883.1 PfkB family carbohydrate kinase [Nocardioides zeae]
MPLPPHVTCVGGAVLARSYRIAGPVVPGASHAATGGTSYGGVARNVADNLVRLGVRAALVSVVGDDVPGRALLDDLDRLGIDRWAVRPLAGRTSATRTVVLGPDGELVIGASDMGALDEITPEVVAEPLSRVDPGSWVFADASLPSATHTRLATARRTRGFRLAVDTVSVTDAARLPADLAAIDVLFTNLVEARALLADRGRPADGTPAEVATQLRTAGVRSVVITLGAQGQLVADAADAPDVTILLPAAQAAVVDVAGAGDAMVGGTLADLVRGVPLTDAVRSGAAAAALSTESPLSVHPGLSRELVAARRPPVPQAVG